MKVETREIIVYTFTNLEVIQLRNLNIWDFIVDRLKDNEEINIEQS